MHLNDAVFSFGILNTDLKCSVSLEQNSLEPAHMKSSTCIKLLSLSIFCFVPIRRVPCHILILWLLTFEICHRLIYTTLWMHHTDHISPFVTSKMY